MEREDLLDVVGALDRIADELHDMNKNIANLDGTVWDGVKALREGTKLLEFFETTLRAELNRDTR